MANRQSISVNNLKRMTRNDLISCLSRIDDIFDFFTALARYVKDNDGACTNYNSWINKPDIKRINDRIRVGMRALRSELKEKDVKNFIDFWEKNISTYINDIALFCLCTLLLFDGQDNDLISDTGTCIIGPLSTDKNMTNMVLYPSPPISFQQTYFDSKNMHEGRNTIKANPSDALSALKRYTFIPLSELGDYTTFIHRYTPNIKVTDKDLIVAISPIRNQRWFNINYDDDNNTFSCNYTDKKLNETINNNICKVIDAAAKAGVNILAFPEMIMNKETEDYVKTHIFNNPEISNNIIMIALGTLWNDNKNEGCLLSGTGSVLWRGKKRIRYDHYDKEQNKNYREDLRDVDGPLYMLDVEGIGRICWEICRDCLAQEIDMIYQRLGANLYIISAYSSSLDEMINKVKGYGLQNGAISLTANYCFCNENNNDARRGFVYIPQVHGKLLTEMNPPYCMQKQCAKMECDNQPCAWKCTINKELQYEFEEL